MKALHIAISGRAFAPETGGIREYSRAMTRAMLDLDSPHRFSIYHSDPELVGRFAPANEVLVEAPHKFLWDHRALPKQLHHDRPDVVWYPQNVCSMGLKIPCVVSVADLLYFRLPGVPFREYPWLDTMYMRAFIPRSLRRAKRIMAISEWTETDIHKALGIPREKITAIHLAAGAAFRPVEVEKPERPFFLYVGSLSLRKNVQTLIRAFAAIMDQVPEDLVITGVGPVKDSPVETLIRDAGAAERVRIVGRVSEDELVRLYNQATAFVFPSRYEGFGIPPLEAMACACPVISSDATSLSEVVGDKALTFDPMDVQALSGHLVSISGDIDLRERLGEEGLQWATRFNYSISARMLLNLLEEAAA